MHTARRLWVWEEYCRAYAFVFLIQNASCSRMVPANSNRNMRFAVVVIGLLSLSGVSARAEQVGENNTQILPPVHAERFDDWEIVCARSSAQVNVVREVDATGASACRLQQAQAVNGGRDVAFLFNIVLQKSEPIAIVSAPLNVYLPAGVELTIDRGKTQRAAFETCNISGCHAGFALNEALLVSLKRGAKLVASLQDGRSKKIPVTVSLRGITAGLKRLDELSQGDRSDDRAGAQ